MTTVEKEVSEENVGSLPQIHVVAHRIFQQYHNCLIFLNLFYFVKPYNTFPTVCVNFLTHSMHNLQFLEDKLRQSNSSNTMQSSLFDSKV